MSFAGASNATAAPPDGWLGIDMTPIFSPFYWGTVCSLVLSGITIMQAWIYFPSKDRLFVQATALFMILLDMISTALVSQGMYHYFVPNFGSVVPLGTLTPPLAAECYVSVMIILLSHLYFTWQSYNVMPKGPWKYIVPGIVFFFAMIAFGGGLACSTTMFTRNHDILTNRSHLFKVVVGISKGAAAVADIVATIAMCLSLINSSTGIRQTDSLLKALASYIIERGVLVTFIQTLILVIFFVTPSHTYWLALHPNVTRLYANTFFAMLNGRKRLIKNNNTNFLSTGRTAGTGGNTYAHGQSAAMPKFGGFSNNSQTGSQDDEKTYHGMSIDRSVVVAEI